jgi:hypothetical protein
VKPKNRRIMPSRPTARVQATSSGSLPRGEEVIYSWSKVSNDPLTTSLSLSLAFSFFFACHPKHLFNSLQPIFPSWVTYRKIKPYNTSIRVWPRLVGCTDDPLSPVSHPVRPRPSSLPVIRRNCSPNRNWLWKSYHTRTFPPP